MYNCYLYKKYINIAERNRYSKVECISFNRDKEHHTNWIEIPDHPYRILIVGGSGSGKANGFLNLIIKNQILVKKILYAKDPYEAKYHLLINKRENTGLKY